MGIYLFLFVILLYCIYKYDIKDNTRYRYSVFWGVCLAFILMAGLRYRIGGDSIGYSITWHQYPDFWDFDWFEDIEACKNAYPEMARYQMGWFLFAIVVLGIWKNHIMMQIAIAILLNWAIFRCIKKYSKYPFITIMIFYFNFSFLELEFEVMREAVAVSIFLLLSYDNYVDRNWLKYYIGTTLAYLIHPSAILMFALPFFRNLNLSLIKNTLLFVVPPIVIAVAGRILLGSLLLAVLNQDNESSQYAMKAVDREYNSNYILMYLYKPLCIYLLVATCYTKIKDTIYSPIIFITLFCLFLSLLYFTGSRLANYILIPAYIGLSPVFVSWIKRFKSLLTLILILIILNVSTVLGQLSTPEGKGRYFPYQNVIFPNRSSIQKQIDRDISIQ